jgi:hypothetical protein
LLTLLPFWTVFIARSSRDLFPSPKNASPSSTCTNGKAIREGKPDYLIDLEKRRTGSDECETIRIKLQRCNSALGSQSGSGRSRRAGSPESALHEPIPKNLVFTDGKPVLRSAILGNGSSQTVNVTGRLIRRVKTGGFSGRVTRDGILAHRIFNSCNDD